jgi:site-specific DNA-methyltransferase (adenine-specific)
MYGSGFPKSLDVSKAIDKAAGAEREIVGQHRAGIAKTETTFGDDGWSGKGQPYDLTAPSTEEAKQWEGWGTALKPAFEPIVVARKPLIGTVAENVLTHGTGGLNIDRSRIASSDSLFRKSSIALPENQGIHEGYQRPWKQDAQKVAEANERTQEKSAVADSLGRWPANVILDEYTAELLDEQSGNLKSGKLNTENTKTSIFGNPTSQRSGTYEATGGGASRFFYVAKASKRDRNEGLEELDPQRHSDRQNAEGVGGDNPRNRTNEAKQNFHPTVKPTDLMRYLIKLVTPPGGVVLDPFTGSGSTGKAAILEGFRFIGCELTEDYIPIIQGRLQHAEAMAAEAEAKKEEALF